MDPRSSAGLSVCSAQRADRVAASPTPLATPDALDADAWSGGERRSSRGRSLVRRLALLAVLPAAVTALLLMALSTTWHLQQLRALSLRNAEAVASQIATMLADPIAAGDRSAVQRLALMTREQPDLYRVRVLANNGVVLADTSAPRASAAPETQTVRRDIRSVGGALLGTVEIEMSLAQVLATQRADALKALALLALSLLIAGWLGWRAARRIGAPITALAQAVTHLGGGEHATGERAIDVPITGLGEIGQLQRGFNAAAQALHDSHKNLRAQIAAATQELEHKNHALEMANLARARFLAAASHDLRQPLYALTLFSSALALGEKDPARLSRIGHIQDCVGSLDRLFNELLDLSRLDAGAMQPAPSEFALDDLFDEVSRTFRMAAEERGLRLLVRKTDVWVRSDRVMLGRVLNNLVSNAIRYTQSGGVLVGARRCNGGIRIDVWDTGPGIAPEHQTRVFEEFYQAHCVSLAQAGERRGLGLGLATVQRLCHLLDTPIVLRSIPGRGSLFSVSVPQTMAKPAHARPRVPERPLDVSGLRVLVIDDEPAILEGIRILMGSWGCEIATAEDGPQALQIAREWTRPPDIVISDLQLGGGRNGLEVLDALDRHYTFAQGGRAASFARLLITGETKGERLREISAAKIPVLFKPVTPDQLREAMVATLAMERAA